MPCIDRGLEPFRIHIYTNDHRPSHVHVIGPGMEAVFNLNCPSGPIELRESLGFKAKVLTGVREYIVRSLGKFCAAWSDVHGAY